MRHLLLIIAISITAVTSAQDTTFTNYDQPAKIYLYDYTDYGTAEEKPMNELMEGVYFVGWSPDGKLGYVKEPPDENCGCYFFEARIIDLNTNEQEFLYHYSNIDYVHGDKETDSTSADINCDHIRCAWYSNYNQLAPKFHEAGIIPTSKTGYYPESSFTFESTYLHPANGEESGSVEVKIVEEKGEDTLFFSYDVQPGEDIKEVSIAGIIENPNKRGQATLLIREIREGLNPETDELVTFQVLGMNRSVGPDAEPIRFDDVPVGRYVSAEVDKSAPYRHVSLNETKSDKIGALADEEWFAEHGKWIRAWSYGEGAMTEQLKSYYVPHDQPRIIYHEEDPKHLALAIEDGDRAFYMYGEPPNQFDVILDPEQLIIYNIDSAEIERWYDFSNFEKINWVQEEDSIIYVSHSHNTYASSTNGINAQITAIDLRTDKILWRSKPLVSNSVNFEIIQDVIITGYGFTSEDDFIYLLNRKTGEVVDKIGVASAPDWFSYDNERLNVRTYDASYQFEVEGSFFESY